MAKSFSYISFQYIVTKIISKKISRYYYEMVICAERKRRDSDLNKAKFFAWKVGTRRGPTVIHANIPIWTLVAALWHGGMLYIRCSLPPSSWKENHILPHNTPQVFAPTSKQFSDFRLLQPEIHFPWNGGKEALSCRDSHTSHIRGHVFSLQSCTEWWYE